MTGCGVDDDLAGREEQQQPEQRCEDGRPAPRANARCAEDLRTVAEAAGLIQEELYPELSPQVVSTGLPYLIVPARTEDAVRRARPDQRLLDGLLESVGASGYYLAWSDGDRAHARMFGAPGILEDPATGSAAGPLCAYLNCGVAYCCWC